MDWSKYPNFSESEFKCSHTGKCFMREPFMDRLQRLRTEYGKPITITSGYRHSSHPVERNKSIAGTHTLGCACDISVRGADAYKIIELAIKYGFRGIGVSQKGGSRFLHLDDFAGSSQQPRPTIWSY